MQTIEDQRGLRFVEVVALMERLLRDDGCPWDRAQTLESLKPYLLEETYELLEAIDGGTTAEHQEELGDVLFQVVFQAALRAREGAFGIDDVCAGLVAKMTRRHPHVFGELQVKDADEVLANWRQLKRAEKEQAGKERRTLAGVPHSMPALARAAKLGERAAHVGFDWPDVQGVRDKIAEELAELDEAMIIGDRKHVEHEIGDLLFTITRIAAKLQIDPEGALRAANQRFERRFAAVEDRVHAAGQELKNLKLEDLDLYWQQVKREQETVAK